jgi:NADH:ubiquinone oxidoreductase subunit 6 (subunit J)
MLAALVGGTGVVIVFGFLLLGISRGKTASHPTTRYALLTLSGLCGVIVIAVAAIGVYAMTQKPSSAKPKPKTTAALSVTTTPRRLASGPRPY